MKTANRRRLALAMAHALGAVGMMATAVHAQQVMEKIQVTGSNIKRIDTETPSPGTIITREQIQQGGQRDIAELLRNVSAASAGSIQDNSSGSFSGGAQTVSLPRPGAAATPVLPHRRRL